MGRHLQIGQFNDSFKPIMDGVALCAENYTRWLDQKYGRAYAVVPHVPRFHDDDPFVILRYPSLPIPLMPPYRIGLPWASPSVGRFLLETKFDLVHSHTPFVAGRMATRIARRHGIPHVSTFHTKYRDDVLRFSKSERFADGVVQRIVKLYEGCDAVWSPSESTAQTLRDYGYEGEITIAPNGSDFLRPSDSERATYRALSRELLPWTDERFCFLFVGQHRWEKNVELIIRSVAELHRLSPEKSVGLVFVGEGYASADMQALVDELGISDLTVFLGKIIDRELVKRLFARADLFLFPSLYDNAPLVMREAAAFGVATVVAAGSSAAEVVQDGVNGFVVENDPSAMAEALSRLSDNVDLVRAVGGRASRTIYRGWEEIIDWAAGEYERILALHAGSAAR